MASPPRNRFSLHQFLSLFLAASVILFIALESHLFYRLQEIQRGTEERHLKLARDELSHALHTVENTLEELSSRLQEWDELHQQLDQPAYYPYWRENRILNSTFFPRFITSMELYDPSGKILSPPLVPLFPTQLNDPRRLAVTGEGRLQLLYPITVPDRSRPGRTAGYALLAVDLLEAIRSRYIFTHLKADSLRVREGLPATLDGESLDPQELFQFSPIDLGDREAVTSLALRNTLYHSLLIAGGLLLVYLLVIRFISSPLRSLVRYLETLRRGAMEENPPSEFRVSELETLRKALVEYHHQLRAAHAELDHQNSRLWQLAHHDPLTGACNRLAFEEDWNSLIGLLDHQRIGIAYMLVDCDHFKAINDTYGHQTGDALLRIVAQLLQRSLRSGDKLYRLGGDEFAAVIINSTADSVMAIAERFQERISRYPFGQLGIDEPVTISIGIAIADEVDHHRLRSLPRDADLAMYHAKRSRKAVEIFRPEMGQDAAILSSRLVNAVLRAINHGDNLEMHYQAVVSADGNHTCFYEALARLRDGRELIMPCDIFPVVTRHRLDAAFDHAVIRAVSRDLIEERIPAGSGVSINLSAASVIEPSIEERLVSLRAFAGSHRIVIEVTEGSLISHLEQANRNLDNLRRRGFTIALDDFGSGYSSIRYLASMPVDLIKFDITLLQALRESERSRRIVEHVALMIREAGFELLAEGIEDEETLQLVTNIGATLLQGYLLARPGPMPGSELNHRPKR
ncbi:MAG TPA: EAL domain-containing protein [Thiotrichales bacterium]|nr:EAL domain-containing protein [Thiotrichales bacterium]